MEPSLVRLFGLCIQSDIRLPGPETGAPDTGPDLVIEVGRVPAPPNPVPEVAVDEHGATLTIEGVARYRISGGAHIVVEAEAGVPEANVRLFLLGSAMGVLLHQRGLLPLHASAVEIDGQAIAFAGPSGAGKSTLAAAFHDRGHRLIADDVCVIEVERTTQALAYPGIPRLRLWQESLDATGRKAEAYSLSYAGDETFRKFDVPVVGGAEQVEPTPLAALFLLGAGEKRQLRRISGSQAADAIFANTYRGEYLRLAGQPSRHWQKVVNLVRSTPMFDLSRPRNLADLAGDVGQIVQVIRAAEQETG